MSKLLFINSNRGKAAAIFQKYFYTERKILKNGEIIFMCPKKDCYASIKIDEHRRTVLEIRGEHTRHLQLTDSEIEKHERCGQKFHQLYLKLLMDLRHFIRIIMHNFTVLILQSGK
ncbi:uncharacterized protein LOC115034757 [Acyrthosiphon pisum]|uniref:Uncharacterized protein n=1 Tax=Acyrthosiphon pisum TaxID=7029 RepID=A0A8R2NXE1_ACYPI|nr:uncharacterized protein LOC115034757 [Acyrthosiphon pisum]